MDSAENDKERTHSSKHSSIEDLRNAEEQDENDRIREIED
jgi:hypothetical protein